MSSALFVPTRDVPDPDTSRKAVDDAEWFLVRHADGPVAAFVLEALAYWPTIGR